MAKFNIGETLDTLTSKLDSLGRDVAAFGLGVVFALTVTWVF